MKDLKIVGRVLSIWWERGIIMDTTNIDGKLEGVTKELYFRTGRVLVGNYKQSLLEGTTYVFDNGTISK
jgi:hypothetical protein